MSEYLLPEQPADGDFAQLQEATSNAMINVTYLMIRCYARLGSLAEKVETMLGLQPLKS